MHVRQFEIEGLGHLSTLIADPATGVAAVVDPRRDVDIYLDAARELDLRITHVVETHLHNDYVSGGRDLAALTGAEHLIGVGAGLEYGHRAVRHGDAWSVGTLRFVALDTPGHTPEHVSYAVSDTSRADEPVLLFTGGSLLVGAVGRTDLLGADNAIPYARSMFASLHDVILPHADFVGVYPTHGAGSLCSTGISSTPNSTIGFERRYNRMLQAGEPDQFARALLAGQPAFPKYFGRMRPLNRAGPPLLRGEVPAARSLSVVGVASAMRDGAQLVDLRPAAEHVAAHIPGSISIPADASFGTWLGWVVEPDRPVILLLPDPGAWDSAIRQALRIGYESVLGYVDGGLDAWRAAGESVESSGRLTVDELATMVRAGRPDRPLVLDVRQSTEFEAGHVPGATHLFAGNLSERLEEMPRDRAIATVCASGFRSSIAASLLRAAGFTHVSWVAEGVPAWEARGFPIERAPANAHGAPV